MAAPTTPTIVSLDDYLVARDAALNANAKLSQARKDVESAKRREQRLNLEASTLENEAIAIKKQLDTQAATPAPAKK